ncbi:MAG: serine hydrolase domain-containing protein [bacterium]
MNLRVRAREFFSALFCLPLWLLAQSGLPHAEAPSLRFQNRIIQARDSVLAAMHRQKLPGLSIAVAQNHELLWSEGFGYADVENRVAVTPLTKFRIGSVSKPVTAAGMALMAEQNKLDLEASVRKYVPSFPPKRYDFTTRQLAGHLAGIRHYAGEEFLSTKHYPTVLSGLTMFERDTLLFKPGEKFSYTSYGWNLISAVVEAAAQKGFLAYMREQVFRPLAMTHTVADHVDSLIAFRTRFYERDSSGNLLNAPFVDNSYKWAGGGFLSTPEDLLKFGAAHLEAGFLKKETLAMLLTSQKTNDGKRTEYGLGWILGKDDSGRAWFGHGGGSVGGTAYLIIYPEQKIVLAVLTNIGNANFRKLPEQLAQVFMLDGMVSR